MKVYFARGGNERRGGFNDRGRGRSGGYGDGPPRRDFGDRPKGCFNCAKEGHMARDCPERIYIFMQRENPGKEDLKEDPMTVGTVEEETEGIAMKAGEDKIENIGGGVIMKKEEVILPEKEASVEEIDAIEEDMKTAEIATKEREEATAQAEAEALEEREVV